MAYGTPTDLYSIGRSWRVARRVTTRARMGPRGVGVNERGSRCEHWLSGVHVSTAMNYGTPMDPYSIKKPSEFKTFASCISGALGPNPRV